VTKVDVRSETVTGTTIKGETKTFKLPSGRQESLEELKETIIKRVNKDRLPTLVTIAEAVGKEGIVDVRGTGGSSDEDVDTDRYASSDEDDDDSRSEDST
jgi:hypothetical protein